MNRGEQKFYICKHCGNLVGMIKDGGVPFICCGEKMTELVANTADASQEKHVPFVTVKGDTIEVQVGETPHPMQKEHFIEWIYLETEKGGQRKALLPETEPKVNFVVVDDKPVAVFAYCNLHSLWKKSL